MSPSVQTPQSTTLLEVAGYVLVGCGNWSLLPSSLCKGASITLCLASSCPLSTLAIFSSFSCRNSSLELEAHPSNLTLPTPIAARYQSFPCRHQPYSHWLLHSQQILPASLQGSLMVTHCHSRRHCALALWSLNRLQCSQMCLLFNGLSLNSFHNEFLVCTLTH